MLKYVDLRDLRNIWEGKGKWEEGEIRRRKEKSMLTDILGQTDIKYDIEFNQNSMDYSI